MGAYWMSMRTCALMRGWQTCALPSQTGWAGAISLECLKDVTTFMSYIALHKSAKMRIGKPTIGLVQIYYQREKSMPLGRIWTRLRSSKSMKRLSSISSDSATTALRTLSILLILCMIPLLIWSFASTLTSRRGWLWSRKSKHTETGQAHAS